jgi:chitin disaccharide deacetylase
MSKSILFNADDWGLSRNIHKAITSLAEQRAIDAAGIMVGQRYTQDAVEYAKAHQDLLVGIHLFANDPDCRPLTRDRWPFLWPDSIDLLGRLIFPFDTDLILAEVRAQLHAYRKTGLRLNFINSHFHFHAHPKLDDEIREEIHKVFPNFSGWLRLGEVRLFPVGGIPILQDIPDTLSNWIISSLQEGVGKWKGTRNDTLWGLDSTFRNNSSDILKAAESLDDGFHEFFFHPGRGKSLADKSTDQAVLVELAQLLPRSSRNISSLSV